jgi:poly(A) polymerase
MGRKTPPPPRKNSSESVSVLAAPQRLVPRPDDVSQRAAPRVERYDVPFDPSRVDLDAQKVVRRLVRSGWEGYLVGGCVRDLLLGRRPKDFDVATSARPEDVRGVFRNSRIIGRRFRLAHVFFGGAKVIEVATFRRSPVIDADPLEANGDGAPEVDLFIRNDNAFGEAHEDAVRRDFTINALFYDLEQNQIIDWVGGMQDIERRVVRTIGDPETRFREDPIRILRAIKFAARLDLGIDPDVYDAMVATRATLARAARPRLFEEILRLLRGGGSHRSFWIAWEAGVLAVLLPELAAYLDDEQGEGTASRVWRLLGEIDRRTNERGKPLDDIVLITLLLLEPMKEACEGERDRISAAFAFLDPVIERLAVPRRIADAVRRIVAVLPRLTSGRASRFARTSLHDMAMEIVEIERAAAAR